MDIQAYEEFIQMHNTCNWRSIWYIQCHIVCA